jgi:hypothetical protein
MPVISISSKALRQAGGFPGGLSKSEGAMELKAVLNTNDRDMVEVYSLGPNGEYLAAVMHIDNFGGPVNERINEGHPVSLHLEIAQPKAYRLLEMLADEGFDSMDTASRETAMSGIEKVIKDLAYNRWSYEEMMGITE